MNYHLSCPPADPRSKSSIVSITAEPCLPSRTRAPSPAGAAAEQRQPQSWAGLAHCPGTSTQRSGWVLLPLELGLQEQEFPRVHRIMECPELEGTHQHHGFRTLALHTHSPKSQPGRPWQLLELSTAWGCQHLTQPWAPRAPGCPLTLAGNKATGAPLADRVFLGISSTPLCPAPRLEAGRPCDSKAVLEAVPGTLPISAHGQEIPAWIHTDPEAGGAELGLVHTQPLGHDIHTPPQRFPLPPPLFSGNIPREKHPQDRAAGPAAGRAGFGPFQHHGVCSVHKGHSASSC